MGIRPGSDDANLKPMLIHRYHRPYYEQVAVFFWPILFFELWRVDRWTAETGRRAFVEVDRYGRVWVPFFESMSQKPNLHGVAACVYRPCDVADLCPQIFARAVTRLTAVASASWGLGTKRDAGTIDTFGPWIPACAGIDGTRVHLNPG